MDQNVKDNAVAKKLRAEANEFYKNNRFYDALVKYNQSLCVAIVGSEEMGLAYGNRSAVYFEIKEYHKAISNIHKALENGYPKEKINKLLEREKKSEELKKTKTQNEEEKVFDEIFKLSYEPNPKYPSFANCIEMRENKEFGRYLITNRDLRAGDVITIEEFFYYRVMPKSSDDEQNLDGLINYQMCAFCLKDNLLDLYPCVKCAHTMYCSLECATNRMNRGHFLECAFVDYFNKNPKFFFAFHCFFTALSFCDNSIEKLQELIGDVENPERVSVFDFDFSKLNEQEKNDKLVKIMFSAHTRTSFDNIPLLGTIEQLFIQNPITASMLESHDNFIYTFIMRLQSIMNVNNYSFSKVIPKKDFAEEGSAGTCMCPGLTLANHSCAPNVVRVNIGKRYALVVFRKIKAGEQLFDCYGRSYICQMRIDRQEYVEGYDFECACEACVNDYPLLDSTPIDGEFIELAKRGLNNFIDSFISHKNLTPIRAKKMLQDTIKILDEKFDSTALTKDFLKFKMIMINCMEFIAKYGEKIP